MRPLLPIPISDGPAFINLPPMLLHPASSSPRPRQRRRCVQYQHRWLVSRTSPIFLSFSLSSNPSSSYRPLLLGLWQRSQYNRSPQSSRRAIRTLLQRLSRVVSKMGRRTRTTPPNKLVRFHTSQLDRYVLFEPPSFFSGTSIPFFNQPSLPTACPRSSQQSRSTTTSHMPLSERSSEDGEIALSFPPYRFNAGSEVAKKGGTTTSVSPPCLPVVQLIHSTDRARSRRQYRRGTLYICIAKSRSSTQSSGSKTLIWGADRLSAPLHSV